MSDIKVYFFFILFFFLEQEGGQKSGKVAAPSYSLLGETL